MSTKRTILLVAVGLLISGASWAVDSDAIARAGSRVVKGDAALQKSDFVTAETHYRKAVEFAPELPPAHLGLGAALVGQRRYAEALEALAEAERRYIEYDKLFAESGHRAIDSMQETERQLENFKETYGVFQRGPKNQILTQRQVVEMNVTNDSPVPAHLFYLQGVALLRTGDKVSGIERLDRCLAIDGGHGLAHHNLAVALYSLGRYQEAARHLEQAIAAGVEPPAGLVAEIEARTREQSLADAS